MQLPHWLTGHRLVQEDVYAPGFFEPIIIGRNWRCRCGYGPEAEVFVHAAQQAQLAAALRNRLIVRYRTTYGRS